MKRLLATVTVIALAFSLAGCGNDVEMSDTSDTSAGSGMYASVEEMQADVEGTYVRTDETSEEGVYYTVMISSSAVTTLMSFTGTGNTVQVENEITEWLPESGEILLDDDSDNMMSVTEDGDIIFGSAVYERDQTDDSLADKYSMYVSQQESWQYFSQQEDIPLPSFCFYGVYEFTSEDDTYVYVMFDDSYGDIYDVAENYYTILTADCGLTVEESDYEGFYYISKDSEIIAAYGTAYNSDINMDYLAIEFY